MAYNQSDAALEFKHLETIKMILGRVLFVKDLVADLKFASDLIVVSAKDLRVSIRVRQHRYLELYGDQFTIRWSRPSGVETEIHKIRKRHVRFGFYGFESGSGSKIAQYIVQDWKVFLAGGYDSRPLEVRPNNPHDSELAAWSIHALPSEFFLHIYPKAFRACFLQSRKTGEANDGLTREGSKEFKEFIEAYLKLKF